MINETRRRNRQPRKNGKIKAIYIHKYDKGMDVQYFDSEQAAANWKREKKQHEETTHRHHERLRNRQPK